MQERAGEAQTKQLVMDVVQVQVFCSLLCCKFRARWSTVKRTLRTVRLTLHEIYIMPVMTPMGGLSKSDIHISVQQFKTA